MTVPQPFQYQGSQRALVPLILQSLSWFSLARVAWCRIGCLRMKTSQWIVCITALIAPLTAAHSQGHSWTNAIPAEKARAHVHERAAVFGRVYHVSWDSNVYFDFGGFYSEAVFTAVIPNANQLVSQLIQLEGKEIVARGRITTNSFGIPQIRVKSAGNILMVGPDNRAVPLNFDPEPPTQQTNSTPPAPPPS